MVIAWSHLLWAYGLGNVKSFFNLQVSTEEQSSLAEIISSLNYYMSAKDQDAKDVALHKLSEATLESDSTLLGWMVSLPHN